MTRTDPTFYQRLIAEHITQTDPRHVEAWMRLEHGTLDGLCRRAFDEAVACVRAAGPSESEALAASFGL